MKMKIKNIPAAIEKIEALNKRAKKLHLPALSLQFGEKDTNEVEFYISGEMPVLNGWHLVATINHEDADDAIINVLPGESLPGIYRKSRTCEHCSVNRYRKDTFIVQHENGEYKQVGRQCLADFIGDCDPAIWLKTSLLRADAFDALIGCNDDDWIGWKSKPSFALRDFLESAEKAIWAFGWAPSSSEYPTKYIAWDMVNHNPITLKMYMDKFNDRCKDGQRDSIVDINAVITWAENLTDDSCADDYLYNIRTIAQSGYVTRKTAGYSASMIMTYQREQAKQLKLEQAAAQSKHFGTIKKREIFELVLDRVIPFEGHYGVTYLHIFHDSNGNRAIWYGSSTPFEVGINHKIKATVKDHNERDGVSQTVLTRCKAL